MKGLPFVLFFTAMTFVAWGAYGPVLHHGALALEHDSMRAFVGVGLAYFLIGVIIPWLILQRGKETGKWTLTGAIYSLAAGSVGAIGALGIILALGYGGQTVYVMPLVFGFAPIVNTLVTAMLSRTFNQISPIFVIGIITAAVGAGGVLTFKPSGTAASADSPPEVTSDGFELAPPNVEVDQAELMEVVPPGGDDQARGLGPVPGRLVAVNAPPAKAAEGAQGSSSAPAARSLNVFGVVISIIMAALCWGSYGPMLHIGQGKMSGSRLRPFMCVGLAYFFIAVAAPLVLIYSRAHDSGAWTAAGMTWSILAGCAGAIGALGVILAFNAGGKPYYVMPLIFGFAPVINTFISLTEAGAWDRVSIAFWISLAVVITGAVIVLTNAPKPKPHAPAK
jgi:hypothetical protein